MNQNLKTYLGDAVYANFDGYHIVLTTEDGIQVKDRIFLEDHVFSALCRFVERIYGCEIEIKTKPQVEETEGQL